MQRVFTGSVVLQSIGMKILKKIIFWLFGILLFLVPLILWPYNSEVFEFNKMVLVYIFTILISFVWITRMVYEKKFIFRRTILDLPIFIFLATQLISTLLSIDPLTSWLGYYSRFNGGFISSVCYALFYWAFVSNIDSKKALKLVNATLISAGIVSVYGVLEHFGIDKNLWEQDVQSRVFSTLGQPNWLAAWLVALMPITWAFLLDFKVSFKSKKYWYYFFLSILFFWTLIFSKSRSGFVGFGVVFLTFWIIYLWPKRKEIKKHLVPFAVITTPLFLVCLISGTQWTPSIRDLMVKKESRQTSENQTGATALETGGTESGAIRKIVWKGAFGVWLHYPVFGSGVETFAYSYYQYRPAEHNLTSEWDFIYNKAHNEYLNFLANSGLVGLLSYLTLIVFSLIQTSKSNHLNSDQISVHKTLITALIAGYVSILVTNFFGFSVVPVQLEFFLFPAIAFVLTSQEVENSEGREKQLDNTQKTILAFTLFATLYLLYMVSRYWYADSLYASGKGYNLINEPAVASGYLSKAIDSQPKQALYFSELSSTYARLAVAFNQQKDSSRSAQFANLAVGDINKAVSLSPANVNLKRVQFGIFVMLSTINPDYLIYAREALGAAIKQAPTDAKLLYNLSLAQARTDQTDLAMATLAKTIDLKPNYKDARLAYAFLLIENGEKEKARTQLEYILANIDPSDSLSTQTLEGIK